MKNKIATRVTLLIPLKNKDAYSVRKSMKKLFKNISVLLEKSLTYEENDKE